MSNWDSTLWMQNDADGYSAREDRLVIEEVAGGVEHVITGFQVTQRGAGANLSVDVSAGRAFIQGDDQANQGFYLARLKATQNVPVSASPGSGTRIDRIVVRAYDPNAGGGAGSDADIEVVVGSVGAGAPAEPASAVTLALITRTSGTSTVTNAMIADARPFKGGNIIVENRAPVEADGVNGDVFFRVPSS